MDVYREGLGQVYTVCMTAIYNNAIKTTCTVCVALY